MTINVTTGDPVMIPATVLFLKNETIKKLCFHIDITFRDGSGNGSRDFRMNTIALVARQ